MGEKPVRYSRHLEARLKLRSIAHDVPRQIVCTPERLFSDTETEYRIAVGSVAHGGRRRLMMVAFEETGEGILVITVHPLDAKDVEAKVKSGRWVPE